MKTINGEAMLLGWAESHNGGVTIRLQLSDPDALDAFRAMTVKKGKIAGQRLAYSFVEIGDDEQPVLEPGLTPLQFARVYAETMPCVYSTPELAKLKGGELAKWAGILCNDPLFAKWLRQKYPDAEGSFTPAKVAVFIRMFCGVGSRAELDHNAQAARIFQNSILIPFNRWKEITV